VTWPRLGTYPPPGSRYLEEVYGVTQPGLSQYDSFDNGLKKRKGWKVMFVEGSQGVRKKLESLTRSAKGLRRPGIQANFDGRNKNRVMCHGEDQDQRTCMWRA
jgi:hypothetical protein